MPAFRRPSLAPPAPTASIASVVLASVLAILALVVPSLARADDGGDEPHPKHHWRTTPGAVALGHDVTLDLPDGYAFLAQPEAEDFMVSLGNLHNDGLLGVVTETADGVRWFATLEWDDLGYVKDDEKIDADDLLKTIREGTEAANEERAKKGFTALHVDGWIEPPRYDRAAHHLVWTLAAKDDDKAARSRTVNGQTRILGRRGVLSMTLVVDEESLAESAPRAAIVRDAVHFDRGARYEDFDAKIDKASGVGLVGLILGGAGVAKLVKLGLLAKFWKAIVAGLLMMKKAVIALVAAAGAFLKRLFGRKPRAAVDDAPPR